MISKRKNLKVNVVLNTINVLLNAVFPLITFPYVSRVLSPSGYGQYNFITGIITYFTLVAALGIPIYAVKRLSALRDKNKEFDKAVSEIWFLNIASTLIVFGIYVGFVFIDNTAQANWELYLIYGINILASCLTVEWYFQAKEEFTYITIRNFLIKTALIASVFIFVKKPEDVVIYVIITVASVLLYGVVNIAKMLRHTRLQFKHLSVLRHLKPALFVFLLTVSTSIYVSLDSVMLGYIAGDYFVGQYSVAVRMVRAVVSLATAISAVMIPRLSYLFSTGNNDEYKQKLAKSLKIVMAFTLPCMVGLIFSSNDITMLLSGVEYKEAVFSMQIICPIILFIALSNFVGMQVLFTKNLVKYTVVSTIVGAVVNFSLNMILIPKLQHLGASISTLVAEFAVLFVLIMLGRKHLDFSKFNRDNLISLISVLIMSACITPVLIFVDISYLWNFVIIFIVGVVSYALSMIVLRHSVVMEILKKIFSIFKKRDLHAVSVESDNNIQIENLQSGEDNSLE